MCSHYRRSTSGFGTGCGSACSENGSPSSASAACTVVGSTALDPPHRGGDTGTTVNPPPHCRVRLQQLRQQHRARSRLPSSGQARHGRRVLLGQRPGLPRRADTVLTTRPATAHGPGQDPVVGSSLTEMGFVSSLRAARTPGRASQTDPQAHSVAAALVRQVPPYSWLYNFAFHQRGSRPD